MLRTQGHKRLLLYLESLFDPKAEIFVQCDNDDLHLEHGKVIAYTESGAAAKREVHKAVYGIALIRSEALGAKLRRSLPEPAAMMKEDDRHQYIGARRYLVAAYFIVSYGTPAYRPYGWIYTHTLLYHLPDIVKLSSRSE